MKFAVLALFAFNIMATALAHASVKNVVLVHGAFADGSGWKPVADILEHDGYTVQVVQEPRLVLDRSGPSVLVGHSWGGMIITEVGDHPSVRSLVYVAAFAPAVGESAAALQTKTPPESTAVAPVGGGFLAVKPELFHHDVASDLPEGPAHFAAISQVPIAGDSFGATAKVAAWSKKPSFAVIATQDRMINPELERFMAKRANSEAIELSGSHVIFLSHPKEVASLIEKAARAAN